MRSIKEVKSKLKADTEDSIESLYVQMSGGIHPLMIFVPECFNKGHEDSAIPLTEEAVISEMQEYINFAYDKALSQRGISADRSIWKFKKWLWLLEDDLLNGMEYNQYGIPMLNAISKKYNLEVDHENID